MTIYESKNIKMRIKRKRMMFCQNCGTEIKETRKFCSFCGADTGTKSIEGTEAGKRFCLKCGTELREEEMFCSSCGARTNEPSMEKANARSRFGSYIIDLIVINVIGAVLGCIFGFWYTIELEPVLDFICLLISAGYFTYFFGNGQTPGMKAMNIKLCGTDGTYPIGYGEGFLRWIGMIISGLVMGLGFLWILIDENKQGWHDKLADTYVVVE